MKKATIKTKKLKQIIYNNGYICIGSNYIIKADLVQLDDTLLQDKVNKDEPFYFNKFSNSFGTPPKLVDIIPTDLTTYNKLEPTGLYTDILKTKADIFYNKETKQFSYFNSDYLKVFKDTEEKLNLLQHDKLSSAIVIDANHICLFLIMPMNYRESYLNQFEYIL